MREKKSLPHDHKLNTHCLVPPRVPKQRAVLKKGTEKNLLWLTTNGNFGRLTFLDTEDETK